MSGWKKKDKAMYDKKGCCGLQESMISGEHKANWGS